MLLLGARLDHFVQPVLTCLETESLVQVLAIMQQARRDRVVLLDAQQHPSGCVALLDLLPLMDAAGAANLLKSYQIRELQPPLIQPVVTLAAHQTVQEALPQLQQTSQTLVLVGQNGEVLGLLDCDRLLQRLLVELMKQPAQPQVSKQLSGGGSSFNLNNLGMPFSTHAAAIATPPAASATTTAVQTSQRHLLNPLLELLEHLPVALMLQTSDGKVITRNSLWRKQMSELLNLEVLQQEMAALLEASIPTTAVNPERSPSFTSPFDSAASLTTSASDACQIGTNPNTCICVCPLKTGQEQVLHLVKTPIGNLSFQAGLDLSQTVAAGLTEAFIKAPFQLAPLHDATPIQQVTPFTELASQSWDIDNPQASGFLWLVLAQDMTEQQQLARELIAKNADLMQLNRLKDEFLACISHELRTPLTAVLGLSSLLKDQALGELNQRQVHYAQLIHQSGRHLMAVVNDILDMTRMETGQLELLPELVNIANVCQQAYDHALQLRLAGETSPAAIAALPEFLLDIEPDIEFLVADETRLRQMLMHLLLNALKFTESGKQIGLKINRWGGWIAFTVWDTGPGIPADRQHLIFQKFQQLENPLNRRFEGTGLGLVLTQRLARLHGGDVTFISREGQGSQFTILLPPSPPSLQLSTSKQDATSLYSLAEEAFVDVPASVYTFEHSATSPHNRLVLIVEAVPHYIETLSDQLTHLGYQVAIARAGTEAVEKARRLQPCIILLNPVLPLLAGWDVLTLLKSNPETHQIPIVMTTSKADEAQATRRHADGLLSLPIQSKALNLILQKLVQDFSEPTLAKAPTPSLTLLHLTPGIWAAEPAIANADLTSLLQARQYRILEADDLEQAELLARVWKPSVVVVDGSLHNARDYFQQFSQHTFLASLPLVTLDQETTQAANQTSGLLVFPCLSSTDSTQVNREGGYTSTLLQVIQVAAGQTWQPVVLAIDLTVLSEAVDVLGKPVTEQPVAAPEPASYPGDRFLQELEWLHALDQYLQAAGFRSIIGRSWQEVWQQTQTKSVDLLLICWTNTQLSPTAVQILTTLTTMQRCPPAIVLDHRAQPANLSEPPHNSSKPAMLNEQLPPLLQKLARQTLPLSTPMADLLEQINQTIRNQVEIN